VGEKLFIKVKCERKLKGIKLLIYTKHNIIKYYSYTAIQIQTLDFLNPYFSKTKCESKRLQSLVRNEPFFQILNKIYTGWYKFVKSGALDVQQEIAFSDFKVSQIIEKVDRCQLLYNFWP